LLVASYTKGKSKEKQKHAIGMGLSSYNDTYVEIHVQRKQVERV